MDSYYNREAACQSLRSISEERTSNSHSALQLIKMFETEDDVLPYRVEKDGAVYRLIWDSSSDALEEVVAAFQGIICKKDIAPFVNKKSLNNAQKVKYIRQSLAVTSLGDTSFDNITKNIAEVHAVFKREIGECLQECSIYSSFGEYPAAEMSNRYFTPKVGVAAADVLPLGDLVDPYGLLLRAAGDTMVHTEENKVYYHTKRFDKGSRDYKFVEANPTIFQIGDIVEVQVSFMALPLRQNKTKLSMILRSISMLDSKFSQEALVKKLSQPLASKEPAKGFLKRKVGYSDEHTSVTRAKLSAMQVDGDGDAEQRTV